MKNVEISAVLDVGQSQITTQVVNSIEAPKSIKEIKKTVITTNPQTKQPMLSNKRGQHNLSNDTIRFHWENYQQSKMKIDKRLDNIEEILDIRQNMNKFRLNGFKFNYSLQAVC